MLLWDHKIFDFSAFVFSLMLQGNAFWFENVLELMSIDLSLLLPYYRNFCVWLHRSVSLVRDRISLYNTSIIIRLRYLHLLFFFVFRYSEMLYSCCQFRKNVVPWAWGIHFMVNCKTNIIIDYVIRVDTNIKVYFDEKIYAMLFTEPSDYSNVS